jgi:hypothetical protein
MGDAAQRTAARRFGIERFVRDWTAVFDRARRSQLSRSDAR